MTGGLLIVDTAFVPPGSSFGRRAGALAAETSCATAGKLSGCRGFSGGCSGRRAAGGGRGGAGAAPGGGGAGRCRALPRGHTGLGRAATGTRGCECAMRARRGRCACPRVPLPSRRSSGRQNCKRTTRTRQRRVARRGEIGGWRPRSGGAPQPRAPARRAGVRAGRAASRLHGGRDSGRLQAPPAGRPGSSPFLSTPCSVPHALQGSQTGLQQQSSPQSDLTL